MGRAEDILKVISESSVSDLDKLEEAKQRFHMSVHGYSFDGVNWDMPSGVKKDKYGNAIQYFIDKMSDEAYDKNEKKIKKLEKSFDKNLKRKSATLISDFMAKVEESYKNEIQLYAAALSKLESK